MLRAAKTMVSYNGWKNIIELQRKGRCEKDSITDFKDLKKDFGIIEPDK